MKENRLIFVSDVHYMTEGVPQDKDGYQYYYGEENDFRIQKIITLLNEEYQKAPIDAVVFLGDSTHEKEAYFRELCTTWLPKLPCPAYLLPGNHENYSDEVWREMTGYGRQYNLKLPYVHILMCDCFSDARHPHQLQPVDMDFVSEQVKKYPGEKFLLCTHYFQMDEALEQWLFSTPEVIAIMHGHTHLSLPKVESFGGKKVISTGNFSYGLNMKQEDEWRDKFAWSITEMTEYNGKWKCRKIYSDMRYEFTKLKEDNRFYQEMAKDYDIKREYQGAERQRKTRQILQQRLY